MRLIKRSQQPAPASRPFQTSSWPQMPIARRGRSRSMEGHKYNPLSTADQRWANWHANWRERCRTAAVIERCAENGTCKCAIASLSPASGIFSVPVPPHHHSARPRKPRRARTHADEQSRAAPAIVPRTALLAAAHPGTPSCRAKAIPLPRSRRSRPACTRGYPLGCDTDPCTCRRRHQGPPLACARRPSHHRWSNWWRARSAQGAPCPT